MNGLQLAIVCGCLFGAGIAVIVARLVPAQPDLKSAFTRLDPDASERSVDVDVDITGFQDKVGLWTQRRAPSVISDRVPVNDLAVLRRPLHHFYGEKVLLGFLGLVLPPLFAYIFGFAGVHLPFVVPVFVSLALAALLFNAPDLTVRSEAAAARREFTRALVSYIDLVAMERASGTGSTQSLEAAADVGDSWVFDRIGEELARARWSGQAPWDGLKDLSDQLGLPDLADLAEIMRISREEGASVTTQLRARANSLRGALLNEDLSKANAAGEQMSVPVSALALVFLALIAAPAVMRLA